MNIAAQPPRPRLTRRAFLRLAGLSAILAASGEPLASCGEPPPSPTPAPSPTASPTATAAPTWTPSPTPTATATPSPSATPTATATPTPTNTPTPTATPTPQPTATPGPLKVISLIHGPSRSLVVDHVLQRFDVLSTQVRVDLGETVPDLLAYDAIIFAGGEYRPDEFDEPIFAVERERIMAALEAGVPILGICLGHQLLAYWLGGEVARGKWEIGWLPVTINDEGQTDPLLAGLGQAFYAFLWHGDQITRLPQEAVLLASSERCPVQCYRLRGRLVWGVQFNPQYDPVIADNLVRNTAWLAPNGWDVDDIIATGYREYDDLAGRIFGNFLKIVQEGEGTDATPVAPATPVARPRHLEPR
jgi:GMP synthase (glutamine-hydrolysing)